MNCRTLFLLVLGLINLFHTSYSFAESEDLADETPIAEIPFAFADFTWLNANSRKTTYPLHTKYFTGDFLFDGNYVFSFNRPSDHTLIGSSNSGRTDELQVQQLGIGGDLHFENIRGRILTQFGMYSSMTHRGDSSPSQGQLSLTDAYKYISEGYAGYHFDVWDGLNIDFGLFLSYIGLCSYYNYENWVYQMATVSINTPWYFNGIRIQAYPSAKTKLEFWLINGWQSYGMINDAPGLGFSYHWRPTSSLAIVSNNFWGHETINLPGRSRIHTDNSVQVKYLDQPREFLSKAAFSVTLDAGCESGDGVSCVSGDSGGPAQYFLGFAIYNRFWFHKNQFGLTVGGGGVTNPGRYMAMIPPINGAIAHTGTPYFDTSPGTSFQVWDTSITLDYMPSEYLTLRLEGIRRQANFPYFAGRGGITPPGGNSGSLGSVVPGFTPDLQEIDSRINLAMLIRI